MNLCTTRDISDDVHEKLLNGLNDQFEIKEDFELIQKSFHAPSMIQLLADAQEWATPYLLESSRYLLSLAISTTLLKIWDLRKEINKKMDNKISEPLKKVADCINQAKIESRKDTQIIIGLPIPHKYFGTVLVIEYGEEFELAWILANFIVKAQRIEDAINGDISKNDNPLGGINIKLLKDGSIELSWKRQKDFKIMKMIIE